MWVEDFEPTSDHIRAMDIGRALPSTTWQQVSEQLVNAVRKNPASGRQQRTTGCHRLRRQCRAGPEHHCHRRRQAVPRAYARRPLHQLLPAASKMYDTLMQMGRWFGYRPGYVDLCRLYTTPDLELWFRHVALAAEELRERLDHMAMIGSTPETYGLRIQSHDILLVRHRTRCVTRNSSRFRFRASRKSRPSSSAMKRQISAMRGRSQASSTASASRGSRRRCKGRLEDRAADASGPVWTAKQVAALLANLEFPEEARDVNAARLSAYIREQLAVGELTEWTVAVPSGSGETIDCNGWTFTTIARAPLERTRAAGRYIVKTILSPRDEALDLTKEEFDEALEATNRRRAESKNKKPTGVPDGPEIRRVRGKTPQRALLLLYPLSPQVAKLNDVLCRSSAWWSAFPTRTAAGQPATGSIRSNNDWSRHDFAPGRAPQEMGRGRWDTARRSRMAWRRVGPVGSRALRRRGP